MTETRAAFTAAEKEAEKEQLSKDGSFLERSLKLEYSMAPPLETSAEELRDGVIVIGREDASWTVGITSENLVQQLSTTMACFMRRDHLDAVVKAMAHPGVPSTEKQKHAGINRVVVPVPEKPTVPGDTAAVTAPMGASRTALVGPSGDQQVQEVAPLVSCVAPFHDGISLHPPRSGRMPEHRKPGYWEARGYTKGSVAPHPDQTRVALPEYVITHVMRWTMHFEAAGQVAALVDYDYAGAGRTSVVNGRKVKKPLFDPVRGRPLWREVRVPSHGNWRMPCCSAAGATASTYCRMFGVFFPLVPHCIVHGVAVLEGLHAYSIVPYAVIQIGPSDDALVDVAPDVVRLGVAPFVSFIRLPAGVRPPTMYVLKATNKCSRCGERAIFDCPLGCKCARYCSPECVRLHATRHFRWCVGGRTNHPDVNTGFLISSSPADYQ